MAITRTFLGLDQPPLRLAVDYLLQRYARGRSLDMAGAIVAVPGSRAGRRLLEILVERAEERSLDLIPPQIETVGHLPEQLYRPKKPFATAMVQQLAWVQALRDTDPTRLSAVLPGPPPRDDQAAWQQLGDIFSRQHTELAADGLDFAAVAARGGELPGFTEQPRWQALTHVQMAYLRLLDELGLWDIQTARLVAVRQCECRADHDLLVIGAVDMTLTLRRMLEQVADRVTVLIFAPPEWAERFDGHGCLVPQAWEEAHVPLDDEQVHVVDAPADQADRVARCLAAFAGKYRPDEIAIGLADETITPHVQRRLAECGVSSRSAAGLPLTQTAPCRLLAAVADYLHGEQVPAFSALVRHPAVYAWLQGKRLGVGWLEQLDDYIAEHLPSRFDSDWLGTDREHALCAEVYTAVETWLAPLRADAQPLDRWNEPLRRLLLEIYGTRPWDRDDPDERVMVQAFTQINEALEQHASTRVPARLIPVATAAEALGWLLQSLQTATFSVPAEPEAIELLGWLELPWDDAPALVVTSFNEGFVPSSINSDLFLPNALRSHLGLQDNARRYARDAYALSLLAATRARLELIVARRNGDGDALTPSRLLFATDPETSAERAWRVFQPPPPTHALPPLAGRLTAGAPRAAFRIPRPQALPQPITELSVTAFRDYLACPYRFYLRHVLRLQAVSDAVEELDGGAFGALLHNVLHEFGAGPERDSTGPDEIQDVLNAALDRIVAMRFGRRPLSSVRVQVEQLRLRLSAFAREQAARRADGWRIAHSEVSAPEGRASFDVDGQPFYLRGRIDRIDVRRDPDECAILDYKSSDAAKGPEQMHVRGGSWVDLQLPLYRHLVRDLGVPGTVQLGYVLLPKDTSKVEFRLAEWSAEELADADEVARHVVRQLREQIFWPPREPPPDFSEEFAPLCQDGIFDRDRDPT
jgi:hypothetical protein